MHSNIPATSQSDQELSKNQIPGPDIVVVRLPTTKCSASNLLQAKASNDKSPTIVTPIITVRPDGAGEQARSAPPGKMALQSPSLTGSFEEIALAKPPLVKEITVRMPKSKSLIHQGALVKTEDLIKPKQKTPELKGQGKDGADTFKADDTFRVRYPGESGSSESDSSATLGLGASGSNEATRSQPGTHFEWGSPPLGNQVARNDTSPGNPEANEWEEAASAQVVERGPKVTMYKIPDPEDDTSFMMNKNAKLTPTIEKAVTSPMVVEPLWVNVKAKEAPHEWLKLFGAEWTL